MPTPSEWQRASSSSCAPPSSDGPRRSDRVAAAEDQEIPRHAHQRRASVVRDPQDQDDVCVLSGRLPGVPEMLAFLGSLDARARGRPMNR